MVQIFQEPQIKQSSKGNLETGFQAPDIISIAAQATQNNDLWDKIKEQERQIDLANEQGILTNKEAAAQKQSLAQSYLSMGGDAYRAAGLQIKALNLAQQKKEKGVATGSGGGDGGTGVATSLDTQIAQIEDAKIELINMIPQGVPTVDFWDTYKKLTLMEKDLVINSGLSAAKKGNALDFIEGYGESNADLNSLGKADKLLYGGSSKSNAQDRESDISLIDNNRDNQDFINDLIWVGKLNYPTGSTFLDEKNPIKFEFITKDALANSKNGGKYKPARIFDAEGGEHLNYVFEVQEIDDPTGATDKKGDPLKKYMTYLPGSGFKTIDKGEFDNWDINKQREFLQIGSPPANQTDVDQARQADTTFQKSIKAVMNVGAKIAAGESGPGKLETMQRNIAAKVNPMIEQGWQGYTQGWKDLGGKIIAPAVSAISKKINEQPLPSLYKNGLPGQRTLQESGVVGLVQKAGKAALGGVKNFLKFLKGG